MRTKVLEVNVDDLYSGGVFSLIKSVIIHNNCGVKIDIAAIENFVNPENVEMLKRRGTDVYYVGYEGSKWKKQMICYFRLKELLKAECYDCVHIHGDVANKLFVSGLAAKQAGTKRIILHSHASGVDGNHRRIKRIIHKLCRRFLKYVGTDYVSCSDLAAEWMFPNVRHSDVVIIKNGIDLEKFRFNEQIRVSERQNLIMTDELLIGHVGRFCYQKNHEYLIAIMKEIKKRGIKAKLLLVGEGPDKEKIRFRVADNKLEEYVIFYGISDRVFELYQAMDIFLLPSHFEGLPIVGVEAQASGLPVLFSNKITKDAQLTNYVKYLGIGQEDVGKWVDCVKQFAQKEIQRSEVYSELKKLNFDIQDTVKNFMKLYCN